MYSFPWVLLGHSSGSDWYFPHFPSTLGPFSLIQNHVRNTIHPKLEQEADPPFKLLFHERDFRADTLILTNIVNAIRNSNAAIIIMSQDYVDAKWCRAEFEECMVESMEDPRYKLFVIMMQPHGTLENCTDYMNKYFREKTYLDKNDPNLYDKLVESLRALQSPEGEIEQETPLWNKHRIYCRMPARRGLRRTALAPGRDETRTSDPLVRQ